VQPDEDTITPFNNLLWTYSVGRPARQAVTGLLSRAFLREAVYIAANTLFDHWDYRNGARLATLFTDEFAKVLDRSEIGIWRKIRVSMPFVPKRDTPYWAGSTVKSPFKDRVGARYLFPDPARFDPVFTGDIPTHFGSVFPSGVKGGSAVINIGALPAAMRIMAQAPDGNFDTWWKSEPWGGSGYQLGQTFFATGMGLLTKGKYDAGLSVLTCTANRAFAPRLAAGELERAVGWVPSRLARVLEVEGASDLCQSLDRFANSLALTQHHAAAVHTRLLLPLMCGDIAQFEQYGRCLFKVPGERMWSRIDEPLAICIELNAKGYRTQAVELLAASTGALDDERERWRLMYDALPPSAAVSSGIGARVAEALAPAAATMRAYTNPTPKELTPSIPAVGDPASEGPELAPPPAKGWPKRRVNAWIEDAADDPDDEFDVLAEIGPPRDGAMGGPFAEPGDEHWQAGEVRLRITLSGIGAVVRPGWHEVTLRRVGGSDTVRFHVKSQVQETLQLALRIFLADKMLLIDEYSLNVAVASPSEVA
jgi:hypothetical protein